MLKITSTRDITWPALSLVKGENVFPSRKSVPAELWPKLERFRGLGIVAFDDAKDGDDAVKLEELSEVQLFQMSKAELAEIAKANGIALADDAKKNVLLEALVAKLAKTPVIEAAVSPALPPAEPGRRRSAATVDVD